MKKQLILAVALLPSPVLAHVDGGALALVNGIMHPWSGMDHFLALIVTGVWLSQASFKPRMALLLGFLALLLLSLGVGRQFSGASFEPAIVATLVVMGALVASAAKLPLVASAIIVGATAAIHGFVHGTEMVGEMAWSFTAGLLCSSAFILSLATLFSVFLFNTNSRFVLRVIGALIATIGIFSAF